MNASEEEMSFIRAILTAPDDDAPRLIFADWLQEQGKDDYRIRSQAEWKKPDGGRTLSFWRQTRETKLPDWRDGFIESLQCKSEWWQDNAAQLMTYHPIREVALTTLPEVNIEINLDDIPTGSNPFDVNRPIGTVRSASLVGSKQKHDSSEACYAEWESRWPSIKFVRPTDTWWFCRRLFRFATRSNGVTP